jgi:hypothetical protein
MMWVLLSLLLAYSVIAFAICVRVYWVATTPCRGRHVWEQRDTPSRIYLRCTVCGRESPGWQLFGVPPGCERRRRC